MVGTEGDDMSADKAPEYLCEVTLTDQRPPYHYPVLLNVLVPAEIAVHIVEDVSRRDAIAVTVRPVGRPMPGKRRTDG